MLRVIVIVILNRSPGLSRILFQDLQYTAEIVGGARAKFGMTVIFFKRIFF